MRVSRCVRSCANKQNWNKKLAKWDLKRYKFRNHMGKSARTILVVDLKAQEIFLKFIIVSVCFAKGYCCSILLNHLKRNIMKYLFQIIFRPSEFHIIKKVLLYSLYRAFDHCSEHKTKVFDLLVKCLIHDL